MTAAQFRANRVLVGLEYQSDCLAKKEGELQGLAFLVLGPGAAKYRRYARIVYGDLEGRLFKVNRKAFRALLRLKAVEQKNLTALERILEAEAVDDGTGEGACRLLDNPGFWEDWTGLVGPEAAERLRKACADLSTAEHELQITEPGPSLGEALRAGLVD